MLSLIALAALAHQGLQLQTGVVRLPELVAELAEKSGEPLATAASLKNEVVYINLHPRDTPALMSLIAEVSGCEWVRREKKIELTRTLAKQRADEDIERQQTLESLNRALKTYPAPTDKIDAATAAKAIDSLKRIDPEVEGGYLRQARAIETINPARRLFRRLPRVGSLDWMASVPAGRLWDFGNHPNRYQKALPLDLSPALKQYAEETSLLLAQMPGQTQTTRSLRGDVLGYSQEDLADKGQGPYSVVVSVARDNPQTIDLGMILLSAAGDVLGSTETCFSLTPDPQEVNPLAGKVEPKFELETDPAFWATAKLFLVKEDQEAIAQMRDPVAHEPLKLLFEKPLNSWFEKTKFEGILSLSDQLGGERYFRTPPLLAKPFMDLLQRFESLTLRGGLVLGRPRYPAYSYQCRFDRAIMRELIVRSPYGAPVSLDSLSAYAAKQREGAGLESFETIWLSFAIHGQRIPSDLLTLPVTSGDRDGLRLWNLMTPLQKEAVRAGSQFPLAGLSSQALDVMYSMLYERHSLAISEDDSRPVSVVFPAGLPNGAYFESRPQSDPSVMYTATNGATGIMSVAAAAYVRAQQEHGDPEHNSSGYPLLEGALMRPVGVEVLFAGLRLSPTIFVQLNWRNFLFDPKSNAVRGEDLPGSMGESYRKALESYRKPPGPE